MPSDARITLKLPHYLAKFRPRELFSILNMQKPRRLAMHDEENLAEVEACFVNIKHTVCQNFAVQNFLSSLKG